MIDTRRPAKLGKKLSVCIGNSKDGARMMFNLDACAVPDTGSASLSRALTLPLLRLRLPGSLRYQPMIAYLTPYRRSGFHCALVPRVTSWSPLDRVDGTVQNTTGDRK